MEHTNDQPRLLVHSQTAICQIHLTGTGCEYILQTDFQSLFLHHLLPVRAQSNTIYNTMKKLAFAEPRYRFVA